MLFIAQIREYGVLVTTSRIKQADNFLTEKMRPVEDEGKEDEEKEQQKKTAIQAEFNACGTASFSEIYLFVWRLVPMPTGLQGHSFDQKALPPGMD